MAFYSEVELKKLWRLDAALKLTRPHSLEAAAIGRQIGTVQAKSARRNRGPEPEWMTQFRQRWDLQ